MIEEIRFYNYGINLNNPVNVKLERFIVVEHIKRSDGECNLYLVRKPSGEDSLELVRRMERRLKSSISIAGIKDAVADAFFYVTSRKAIPSTVGKARLYFVGKNGPLSPASNRGNTFRIELSIHSTYKKKVKRLCRLPRSFYMPNYYGPQRFGVIRPVNHIMGKHIIQSRTVLLWLYLKSQYRRGEYLPLMEKLMFEKARKTLNVNPVFPSRRVSDIVRESYYSYLFNLVLTRVGLKPGIYDSMEKTLQDLLDETGLWCGHRLVKAYKLNHDRISIYIEGINLVEGTNLRAGLLDKRPAVVPVCDYSCRLRDGIIALSFKLPSGSYATTLLLNAAGIVVE